MSCGVYVIICNPTGKAYVGSSLCIEDRWRNHTYLLQHRRHVNHYLQAAVNKYGLSAFTFQILQLCASDVLLSLEQSYLDCLQTYNRHLGFNLSSTAGAVTWTPIAKRKLSISLKKAYASGKRTPNTGGWLHPNPTPSIPGDCLNLLLGRATQQRRREEILEHGDDYDD